MMKLQQRIKREVADFLPQISAILSARTNYIKRTTGKHCTLVSLQKYARDIFTVKYQTKFEYVPDECISEIEKKVAEAYNAMKNARS